MSKFKQHIAFLLLLTLVLPKVATEVHFMFFHHHKVGFHHPLKTTEFTDNDAECIYENIVVSIFENHTVQSIIPFSHVFFVQLCAIEIIFNYVFIKNLSNRGPPYSLGKQNQFS